ncbi:MAG TPA: hypothetical protein VLX90_02755 [Steroidobacteraceae bacterium]|nr:hypothetical protein [Steroidobacteraceae bacterium]
MSHKSQVLSGLVLAAAVVLSGCGSTSSPTSTTASRAPTIPFKSPALAGTVLPARYTCDGQNVAPPLEWGAVPPGTAELAVFALGFKPAGPANTLSVSVEWALAGVNPKLHRLEPGALPQGAHLGLTSSRTHSYSICPPKGLAEQYQFELYALPASARVTSNFTGLALLASLHSAGATQSVPRGSFDAVYQRR